MPPKVFKIPEISTRALVFAGLVSLGFSSCSEEAASAGMQKGIEVLRNCLIEVLDKIIPEEEAPSPKPENIDDMKDEGDGCGPEDICVPV